MKAGSTQHPMAVEVTHVVAIASAAVLYLD